MKEAFEKLKRRIEARKETVLPERNYMFGKLGVVSAEATNRTIDSVLSIVSEVEAEYGNGWIPCSERLPENHNDIIICTANGYVNSGYYGTNGFGDMNSYPYEDVIAWMPLPSPFKPTTD